MINEDPSARTRVLLIGIDAYPTATLHGCVNDVDRVQRLLLDKLHVPAGDIRRLVSPNEGEKHEDDVPSAPATLACIRSALAELSSVAVGEDDRVFVYFSGHGTRVTTGALGSRVSREALVPVDVYQDPGSGPRLLFDVDLNAALHAITKRTRKVTVVLDCCHSAGAFREIRTFGDDAVGSDGATRYLPIDDPGPGWESEVVSAVATHGIAAAAQGFAVTSAVIAACQADQRAREMNLGPHSRRHGVFTWSLLSCLEMLPPTELESVSWGRIWQQVVREVTARSPMQQPLLSAGWHRHVFGSEERVGDIGMTVDALADGRFALGIGTLNGVSSGSRVGVYGVEPSVFPAIGTEQDRIARLGTLTVVEASAAHAIAVADDTDFVLPDGARARVVELADTDKLLVLVSKIDSVLLTKLKQSKLISVLELGEEGAAIPDVTLTNRNGAFTLDDDLHGAGGLQPLAQFGNNPNVVLGVLEHCARHRAPLRMARRCMDLPQALKIRILDCSDEDLLARAQETNPQDPELPEARASRPWEYRLVHGQLCCFRVENHSNVGLGVALMACTGSGCVQSFGFEQIPAQSVHTFWNGNLGTPFSVECNGRFSDRLVAIGTTVPGRTLEELAVHESFVDVIDRGGGLLRNVERPFGSPSRPVISPDLWTAVTLAVLLEARSIP